MPQPIIQPAPFCMRASGHHQRKALKTTSQCTIQLQCFLDEELTPEFIAKGSNRRLIPHPTPVHHGVPPQSSILTRAPRRRGLNPRDTGDRRQKVKDERNRRERKARARGRKKKSRSSRGNSRTGQSSALRCIGWKLIRL